MTVSLPSPDAPFTTLAELIRSHARQQPAHAALRDDQQTLSYAQLDALMDRVAAALQRDGVQPGQAIAICALNSVRYAALFLGALRAGVVVARWRRPPRPTAWPPCCAMPRRATCSSTRRPRTWCLPTAPCNASRWTAPRPAGPLMTGWRPKARSPRP